MKTTRSSLPYALIDSYWQQVGAGLTSPPRRWTPQQAQAAIAAYRRAMDDARVGDILYHTDVAATVNAIETGGYVP